MATVPKITINPKAARDAVFSTDLTFEKSYPRFIEHVRFENFRHISNLHVNFPSPVTVVSGSNRSGKTTLLLSIACSHFEFKKRNYSNGKLERQTWSDVLKFTNHDNQLSDWTYHLKIKTGSKSEEKRGQRKYRTKKWNGLGKKESQIKDVNVVYFDLDRILPARYFSSVLHKKAQGSVGKDVSNANQAFIDACISYILEEEYSLTTLAEHLGKDIFGFSVANKYSSYNSASGEDVISRILIDCIEAPVNSLILIDELELGIHPKIQRRLMDVIFEVSTRGQKQFIITTHSGTVISSVPDKARVFIDTRAASHHSVNPISINAALSKMDSEAHPLIDIFCEDKLAKKIISKALQEIDNRIIPGISSRLFNIIISGSAIDTYMNFVVRDRIFDLVRIRSGHVCILDGDMRTPKDKNGNLSYPPQDGLYFLPSNYPPEKLLCDIYEKNNNNSSLRYHINNSNVHCLFQKMQELVPFSNEDEVFNSCWQEFITDHAWKAEFDNLVNFLQDECRRYSPDL